MINFITRMTILLLLTMLLGTMDSCGVTVSEENQKAKEINDKIDNIHGVWIGDDNPKKLTFQGDKFVWTEMDNVRLTGTWEMGNHSKIWFTFDDGPQSYEPIRGEIIELEDDKLILKSEEMNFTSSRFRRN